MISSDGIQPPSSKLELVKDYPIPTTRKELERALRLFIGKEFIPNFSIVASPLHKFLKKGRAFRWNQECQNGFDSLKDLLLNSKVLAFLRFDSEFRFAGSKGIGYMLYQIHENEQKRIVRFGSKELSEWQQSYGPTKLELLGVINSVLDCASYLCGRHFIIECDHQTLKPLFQKQLKSFIYERLLAVLQQFDCDIQWKAASETVVPEILPRLPTFSELL